jgi:ABC-2 type transport system permease protein
VRAFLLLVRLRLLEVGRRPLSGVFFFGIPVLLLGLLGAIFANGHPFEQRALAVVSPGKAPPEELLAALGRFEDLRLPAAPDEEEAVALGKLRTRAVSAVLVLGEGAPRLLVGRRDELFGRGLLGALPGAALEVLALPRFGYVHFLFPGFVALLILVSGLQGMGQSMVRYRQSLFLKKLATTPLPRSTFVASQIMARAALVFAQLALLVGMAALLFGLPVSLAGSAVLLGLIGLGLLVCMGLGFALACVIKTEVLYFDLVNLAMGPVVLLSECFFPAEVLPGPLPEISSALPITQLVRLFRALLIYGERDLGAFLPGILILLAWLVASGAFSLFAFRWYERS